MKLIIVFFSLTLVLFGCKNDTIEKITKVHRDGSPAAISVYSADGNTLLSKKTLHENGNVSVEGVYKNGKKHGKWTSYYVDGQVWTVNHFNLGVYHGDYFMYNKDGTPRIIGHYNSGNESGHWVFYADDGSIAKEMNY